MFLSLVYTYFIATKYSNGVGSQVLSTLFLIVMPSGVSFTHVYVLKLPLPHL